MWTSGSGTQPRLHQHGATLVELIIAMLVIGIAVGGVLMSFAMAVGHSADPLVQQQSLGVAEAYLDEILARPATDPNGGETGGPEAGETRAAFDDVQDYAGLQEAPHDQNGMAVAGLERYLARVRVLAVDLGPPSDPVPAFEVTVTVEYPPQLAITVSGYRALY